MSEPLLRVQLRAGYNRTPVLHDVRFEMGHGEALGLIGTSGAGKSTLVNSLLGLLPWRGGFAEGEVAFEGVNLLALREPEARKLRGRRIALVPQSPTAALNGRISLQTHFEQAWKAHRGVRGDLDGRLHELMTRVKLPTSRDFLRRKPGEISIGQGQRVLIALALLHHPALVIADEPTSALDPVTQREIVALLRGLSAAGTALFYISHDLLSVFELCRRVAILDGGSIAECLPVHGIAETATHPATLAMLEALPFPSALLEQREGFGVRDSFQLKGRAWSASLPAYAAQPQTAPGKSSLPPSWFLRGSR